MVGQEAMGVSASVGKERSSPNLTLAAWLTLFPPVASQGRIHIFIYPASLPFRLKGLRGNLQNYLPRKLEGCYNYVV